jgi:4-hydroxybenzoate polyprenyltransferase
LKPWLRIVRLPLAPTAVCDVLACALLALSARGFEQPAWSPLDWLALVATSLLVYFAGMAANDLADREVDRHKNPDRPLPSGALRPAAVAVAVAAFAAGAVALGGGPRGERWAVVAALAFAGLYDFGLKRTAVPGVLAMGLVRAAHASIPVWPLVIAGSVSWMLLAAPLCIGLYAAAVTLLSTTEDEEAPARVWWSRVLAAVAFAGAAVLAWVVGGLPTLGVAVAFGVASSTLFGRTPRPGPPKRQVLEMLLGLYWLAYVLSSGAHDGEMVPWVFASGVGLAAAWGLVMGSQLLIRWLRPPRISPPPEAGSAS